MSARPAPSVLMVCLGNICRSPSAEVIFRDALSKAGIAMTVDSAGTGDWHVGQPPDERAIMAMQAHGLDGPMRRLRARQVCADDFTRFTHIFAMDRQNLAALEAMRPPGGVQPRLLLSCSKEPLEVPDPYYGGAAGFEYMISLIKEAAEGFVEGLLLEAKAGSEPV